MQNIFKIILIKISQQVKISLFFHLKLQNIIPLHLTILF